MKLFFIGHIIFNISFFFLPLWVTGSFDDPSESNSAGHSTLLSLKRVFFCHAFDVLFCSSIRVNRSGLNKITVGNYMRGTVPLLYTLWVRPLTIPQTLYIHSLQVWIFSKINEAPHKIPYSQTGEIPYTPWPYGNAPWLSCARSFSFCNYSHPIRSSCNMSKVYCGEWEQE